MKNFFLIIMVSILGKCMPQTGEKADGLLGTDVRLFRNTPAWALAQAIEKGDANVLKEVLSKSSKDIIDYQESKYGQSLLIWSVYANHYEGFKQLLEAGADVNSKANDSTQAINWAANIYETSDYLRLLLKHHADVNHIANSTGAERVRTPLIAAAWYSLESTKLLVDAGADINYSYSDYPYYNSPLFSSFKGEKMDVIRYLIIEAKADIRKPLMLTLKKDTIYAVNMLRTLTFDIGSEDYRKKMEVVDFFKRQGIDYWKTPIPKHYYELYDKAYLEKY